MTRLTDNDPGRRKDITNSDEQEVALNHSTADHGYDEPSNEEPENNATNKNEAGPREKPADAESVKGRKPGKDRSSTQPES